MFLRKKKRETDRSQKFCIEILPKYSQIRAS